MRVVVGMSGGVDSTVAALLLKEQGHEVTGISMKIYSGDPTAVHYGNSCYSPDEDCDIAYAQTVAQSLNIPFYVFDLKDAYRRNVIDYIKSEYCSGRTPNPCVFCNQKLKFDVLLQRVSESAIQFDCFATGHYARAQHDPATGTYLLKKARDKKRDQSYFLCMLTQQQLHNVCFPLGDYTKQQVRDIAKKHNLKNYDKADSQDFAAGGYKNLLNTEASAGHIKNKQGQILGMHKGTWEFTIGQRKGLGIACGKPVYVTEIDHQTNTVYVSEEKDLYKQGLIAHQANWVSIASPLDSFTATAQIRSSHAGADATISPETGGKIMVQFREPQKSITPGQLVALYDNDVLLGGAVIERTV
jgi:tRNA-specific 2-thiouridylase